MTHIKQRLVRKYEIEIQNIKINTKCEIQDISKYKIGSQSLPPPLRASSISALVLCLSRYSLNILVCLNVRSHCPHTQYCLKILSDSSKNHLQKKKKTISTMQLYNNKKKDKDTKILKNNKVNPLPRCLVQYVDEPYGEGLWLG